MSKKEFEELLGWELQDEAWKTVEYVMAWHPVFSGDAQSPAQKAVNIIKDCGIDVIFQMVELAGYVEAVSRERTELMERIHSVDRRMEQVSHGNLSEERCRKDVSWLYSISRSQSEWMYYVGCLQSRHGKQMTDRVIGEMGLGKYTDKPEDRGGKNEGNAGNGGSQDKPARGPGQEKPPQDSRPGFNAQKTAFGAPASGYDAKAEKGRN